MADNLRRYRSLFSTTTTVSFGTGTGVTITLASVTGLPTSTEITLTFNRVDSGGTRTPTLMERIVGTISGNNLVVRTSPSSGRGFDSTTEQSHASGAVTEMIWNAADWNSMIDWGVGEHNQDGTHKETALDSMIVGSEAQGDIIYHNGTIWTRLPAGTSGQFLKTQGASANPTWSNVSSVVNLYQNALINGNFDIWQDNTTFTTPNDDTYGPDQWNFLTDGNGAWTFSRSTDVPSNGSAYSLKAVNVTLNKQCGIVQFVENVDAVKFQGKTVSLSFAAKTTTTKEISNLRATVLSWTGTADTLTSDVIGTWAGAGTDPTFAASYTKEITGANKALTTSWQTFTIENIVLDTASITNLAVVIWVDDTTIAANDEFFITQIQMNEGTTASTFTPRTKAQEYMACLRYYEKSYDEGVVAGTNTATGTHLFFGSVDTNGDMLFTINFKTSKRTNTYTVTGYPEDGVSAGNWNYVRSGASGESTFTTNGLAQQSFKARATVAGSVAFTTIAYVFGHWVADNRL